MFPAMEVMMEAYFLIQNNFDDVHVKKDILLKLENIEKRKFISDLISKIENNNFGKNDFDQISKNKNIPIKEVLIKNINDDNFLKAELVEQIYLYPEKKSHYCNRYWIY